MTSETIQQEAPDMDLADMPENLIQLLRSGGTLGEAYGGMTPQDRGSIYRMGYVLYEQGRYRDAFKLFSALVIQDHRDHRYLFALGSTCQMLGHYNDALQHYMNAAAANADDPRPIFHAAQCLIALKHFPVAIESLEMVIEFCPDPQSALHIRSKALLQGLRAKTKQQGVQDEHH